MSRWEPGSRDRLEQAALALYAERGFESTTVAEIAERAGLTERTFFRHFADKREVLFGGAGALEEILLQAVAGAPPSASPIDAVAAGLEALGSLLGQRRPFSRRRQAVIAASAELRERELVKLTSLASALAEALRRRGVAEPAASLGAEAGIAVFRVAFERWVGEPDDADLSSLMRESLAELKALTAGAGPTASAAGEQSMVKTLRVTIEVGPKQKRFVAVAPDWPGLERGAKTGEAATEKLRSYVVRYARVAERLAGLQSTYSGATDLELVEQYPGNGSTDFWGISFAFSSVDTQPMSRADLERQLSLVRACWAFFDEVRRRVSAEMAKGPRGGGRERDQIVRHVLAAEQDWGKKVGVRLAGDALVTDDAGVRAYRDSYCDAIRSLHAEGKAARSWPLRYLIRHTAYHTMDHAWEMEDKDLSAPRTR